MARASKSPSFRKALQRLLTIPTASFHEAEIRAEVIRMLNVVRVSHRTDRDGNVVARLKRGRANSPPLAFVAHMDHPGFMMDAESVVHANRGRPKVREVSLRVLGGVGPNLAGKRVLFYPGAKSTGTITRVEQSDAAGRPIRVRVKLAGPPPPPMSFAVWDVMPYRRSGDKIYARAIDDVCGVAVMIEVLKQLRRRPGTVDLYCCFTSAEEVGFVGAAGMAQARRLPVRARVVSIEMSRAIPGRSEQGKGFVVRVGDRASMFDPGLSQFLIDTARQMKSKQPSFKFQIAVLDGGVCEASMFNAMGYAASGVALPLGNYHNRTPSGGVAPEFIDLRDLDMLVEFLTGLAVSAANRKADARPARGRFEKLYRKWRKFLAPVNRD